MAIIEATVKVRLHQNEEPVHTPAAAETYLRGVLDRLDDDFAGKDVVEFSHIALTEGTDLDERPDPDTNAEDRGLRQDCHFNR